MYKSTLIDRFYKALFSTDYAGYDSATQNAKTDYLSEYDNFEGWFDMLISRFVEEVEEDRKFAIKNDLDVIDPVDEDELRKAIEACPEFVENMKSEYEELREFSSKDDEDEEHYEDGSELFNEDTISGVIEDLLINKDYTEDEEELSVYEKMSRSKDDPTVLKELEDICVQTVCDNEKISNYISEYTISELGDMDGIWNLFGEILEDTIYNYFKD